MSPRDIVWHWESHDEPVRLGAELKCGDFVAGALAAALIRSMPQLGNASFLVLSSSEYDVHVLDRAVDSFLNAGGKARICIAGRRSSLERLAADGLSVESAGFMLDDVDLDSPCSDLIWDRLEAVRFGDRFVARASADMRARCALESMVWLARDLGLRTLGPRARSPLGAPHYLAFDYVPSETDSVAIQSVVCSSET